MPNIEDLQISAESKKIAWQNHVIRTKNRIAQFKALAENPHSLRKKDTNQGMVQDEVDLILREIDKYEQQLIPPAPEQSQGLPIKYVEDQVQARVNEETAELKKELAEVKQLLLKMTDKSQEKNGPVSKSKAAS